MDVTANNIANINTTAYKKSRANYAEQVQQLVAGPATADVWDMAKSSEQSLGSGVIISQIDRDISSTGNIATGRDLDLAIDGSGYLAVELPGGETGYTRDGSLSLDERGYLVTKQGYRILPGIKVSPEPGNIIVGAGGKVRFVLDGSGQEINAGEIHLYNFKNEFGLESLGENIFLATGASGNAQEGLPGEKGYGLLKQGSLELSNVDLLGEMTELIEAQRAYQVNARSVRTSDEMWGMAINLRR